MNWIIAIGGSDMCGVDIYKFHGTEDEVKRKLIELIEADKSDDPWKWDHGTENIDEIEDESEGTGCEFYGYGCYANYHIDYTARLFGDIDDIDDI